MLLSRILAWYSGVHLALTVEYSGHPVVTYFSKLALKLEGVFKPLFDCGHSKIIIDLPFDVPGAKIGSVMIAASHWVWETTFTQWALWARWGRGIWSMAVKGTVGRWSFTPDTSANVLNCQNVVAIQKLVWLWILFPHLNPESSWQQNIRLKI